jgi:hypothetical protein
MRKMKTMMRSPTYPRISHRNCEDDDDDVNQIQRLSISRRNMDLFPDIYAFYCLLSQYNWCSHFNNGVVCKLLRPIKQASSWVVLLIDEEEKMKES